MVIAITSIPGGRLRMLSEMTREEAWLGLRPLRRRALRMSRRASTRDMDRARLERSPQLLVMWAGLGVGQGEGDVQTCTRGTHRHTHTHTGSLRACKKRILISVCCAASAALLCNVASANSYTTNVCMYICMCVCVCMYVCMHACVCVCM